MMLQNFLLDERAIKGSTQWYTFFHLATAIAKTVYYKNVTKNIDNQVAGNYKDQNSMRIFENN